MCYANVITMEALKNVKGVGIVVRWKGQILLCKRTDNGLWGLPGGGIEEGEEPLDAAVRELREETGLSLDREAFVYIGVSISEPNPAKADSKVGCGVDYLVDLDWLIEPTIEIAEREMSDYEWIDQDDILKYATDMLYPASIYTLLLLKREPY
jgi:8-oxo-dGTP pyrophosphatase MutT (NUDIX family)